MPILRFLLAKGGLAGVGLSKRRVRWQGQFRHFCLRSRLERQCVSARKLELTLNSRPWQGQVLLLQHVAVCRAHYVGNGVPQDSVEEVCCFGKAAEQGSAEGEAAHASLRRTPARIHSRRKLASTVEWPTCTRRS